MKRIFIYVTIIVISSILLAFEVADIIKCEKETKNEVEVIGEKELVLKEQMERVALPHLNIKGIVTQISNEDVVIELSEKSQSFLSTNSIKIKNNNVSLALHDKVFVVLRNIQIDDNVCKYSGLEIYKKIDDISIDFKNRDVIICKNDYGGFLKIEGKIFEYNGNIYFLSDEDLSEDGEIYYENVLNGNLLVEEYRDYKFPFKIYKMVNPQETHFFDIAQIYYEKQKKGE